MKRAIILEYLRTIIFAVFTSVAISIVICFFFFFNNHTVDSNMPQILIRSIEKYITIHENEIILDKEGINRLSKYQLWLQIIDKDGKVAYEVEVPDEIPQYYSNFQLVDYVLNSNKLGEYTLFASPLSEYDNYGVLIGCDSNLVTKYTYRFMGKGRDLILKCILVFLLTTTIVIVVASYYFSRKVTTPISKALENIEDIQAGRKINILPFSNGKLFSDVFVSIKKLESVLKKNERLRAEWITNISHDIKTPLSTIKGYAELLTSNDYDFEKKEIILYAEQILKSEEIIKELVDELKISQMLVEGKFKLKLEKVKLAELIKDSIEQTKIYLKRDPIINFAYEKDFEILADKKHLERCFVNIICNAYMHNKKDIYVEIILLDEPNFIKIVISDNGKGMKEEDMRHIFERYYRGTDSGKIRGTGLGLAIAEEVITAHGGEIKVSSILGEGTKFTIFINK